MGWHCVWEQTGGMGDHSLEWVGEEKGQIKKGEWPPWVDCDWSLCVCVCVCVCVCACAHVCVCVCLWWGGIPDQPQSQIWECGNETEGWQANKV